MSMLRARWDVGDMVTMGEEEKDLRKIVDEEADEDEMGDDVVAIKSHGC